MQQFSQPLLECFFQPLLQALPKALAGAPLVLQFDESGLVRRRMRAQIRRGSRSVAGLLLFQGQSRSVINN